MQSLRVVNMFFRNECTGNPAEPPRASYLNRSKVCFELKVAAACIARKIGRPVCEMEESQYDAY